MEEKILKEIEHELKKCNELLEKTDNNDKKEIRELHLMWLGETMALNNLKYSIKNDNWLFERSDK